MPRALVDRLAPRAAAAPPRFETVYHPLPIPGAPPLLQRVTAKKPYTARRLSLRPRKGADTRIVEPLANRLSAPINFQKTPIADQIAILSTRVTAAVTRLKAIWDRKNLFDQLPISTQRTLNQFKARLDWIDAHLPYASTWTHEQRKQVSYLCAEIGGVRTHALGPRYNQIVRHLVAVANISYVDWAQ